MASQKCAVCHKSHGWKHEKCVHCHVSAERDCVAQLLRNAKPGHATCPVCAGIDPFVDHTLVPYHTVRGGAFLRVLYNDPSTATATYYESASFCLTHPVTQTPPRPCVQRWRARPTAFQHRRDNGGWTARAMKRMKSDYSYGPLLLVEAPEAYHLWHKQDVAAQRSVCVAFHVAVRRGILPLLPREVVERLFATYLHPDDVHSDKARRVRVSHIYFGGHTHFPVVHAACQ